MPTWLVLSLLAAFLFASSQVFSKKGLQQISPLWNNIFFNSSALLVWVPIAIIFGSNAITFPPMLILFILLLAGACYALFFYAIDKGDISLTGTLSATYPISTVALSYIFLHERTNILQQAGIIIAIIGVILISIPPNKLASTLAKHKTWVIWGITSALINGTGDFLNKIAVNNIGVYSQLLFLAVCLQAMSVINYFLDKKGRKLPKFSFSKFLPSVAGVVCSSLGFVCFFFALHAGKASLVAPAASIYPALIVFFAAIFLHERITKLQLTGIAVIIAGIMLIGFGG